MPKFLTDLYEKNKVLAWIVGIVVVPVVLIFLFKDVAMSLLAKGAQKDVDDAVKKNDKIQKEVNSLKQESVKHEAKAELLDQQAQKVKEEDDEDWHKKRGFSTMLSLMVLVMLSLCFMLIFNAHRLYYPVASESQCITIDLEGLSMDKNLSQSTVTLKVLRNDYSSGSMDVSAKEISLADNSLESQVSLYFFLQTFDLKKLYFSEVRQAKYEVLNDCQVRD